MELPLLLNRLLFWKLLRQKRRRLQHPRPEGGLGAAKLSLLPPSLPVKLPRRKCRQLLQPRAAAVAAALRL